MTSHRALAIALIGAGLGLTGVGCATPRYTTSPYHPGPVLGTGLGAAVGVTAGNAAGIAIGFGEGFVSGFVAPFDTTTRVIRTWREETTADGRKIQVPYDILVDSDGRPLGTEPMPAP